MEERFEKEIAKLGYDLRYVEWKKEGAEWFLRFFISSEQGISIDDCELVSRYLDPILDEEYKPSNEGYILEVSSPGIEAPLRKKRDYEEAIGSLIHIKLYEKIDGKKEFEGILESFNDDSIMLDINGSSRQLKREMISSARLAVQF
ncbi:ribosome maturation factor RimP [Clostridia bacterium]|nr:ribosome maturation factor RimP [Clostridia bacterium]